MTTKNIPQIQEEKVEAGKKTIDYLFGFVDKSEEIAQALEITGLH